MVSKIAQKIKVLASQAWLHECDPNSPHGGGRREDSTMLPSDLCMCATAVKSQAPSHTDRQTHTPRTVQDSSALTIDEVRVVTALA